MPTLSLRLKYEPLPANAGQFAEDIVMATSRVHAIDLDYSPESLPAVDDIIGSLRQEVSDVSQIAETLFGFGCYVGEVFVRYAGGTWRLSDETPMRGFAGGPLVVELPDGRFCNPIGKVMKRFKNEFGEDLPVFYDVFTDRRRG